MIKNSIALCIGLFITLILLEIVLRIYNPFPSTVKVNRIVLRANAKIIMENNISDKMEPEITVSTNSLGFRGPEPPEGFEKYLTLITVGGSTTHCYFNSDNKTWPFLLGEKLKIKYRNTWINNAGLSGHSTFGHLILLEDYLVKLKPKIVLFLIGINDVGRETEDQFLLYNNTGKMFFKKVKSFLYESEVFGLIVNIAKVIHAKRLNLEYDKYLDLNKLPHINLSVAKRIKELTKHAKYVEDYENRLLTLVKICRTNNIEPVFITQPALFGNVIDSKTKINLGTIKCNVGTINCNDINGALNWDILELYNNAVRKIGNESNVTVIDLAHLLAKDSGYYSDLIHYTENGNKAIADILAFELTDFLDGKYKSFIREKQLSSDLN